jgi:hypothetical protein
MPDPGVQPVRLGQEAAGVGEPPGKREVVQAQPRFHAGVKRGGEHIAVVGDRRRIVAAGFWLDPRPLDREPVMTQPQVGEEPEVLAVADRESVAVAEQWRVPSPFPGPPVGRLRRTLALGRRGAAAPHESVRPSHASSISRPDRVKRRICRRLRSVPGPVGRQRAQPVSRAGRARPGRPGRFLCSRLFARRRRSPALPLRHRHSYPAALHRGLPADIHKAARPHRPAVGRSLERAVPSGSGSGIR